ncbi:MAG: S9 family peptidase, partial [candidate division Zixibacteria bacterium]
MIVKTVLESRGKSPEAPLVPAGPVLQETTGGKAAARTYQDLLKNQHDEDLFKYYSTSQILKVTIDGKSQPIGSAGVISSLSGSPDGKLILAETIHKPYSYTVPSYRFPRRIEVWDADGKVV